MQSLGNREGRSESEAVSRETSPQTHAIGHEVKADALRDKVGVLCLLLMSFCRAAGGFFNSEI